MSNTETRIKASYLLVKALENEAVEYIFGVPGKRILIFLNPFAPRRSG